MPFKYETHMHTSQSSSCGNNTGAEMARKYKEMGYAGVVITDHFYYGNCSVPRNIPWELWVERFVAGYHDAKSEGDKIGLSVFFGFEQYFNGAEFLVYGIDEKWLLNHPDVIKWEPVEFFNRIHDAGGFCIHAHPFREAPHIPGIFLYPKYVDAVEVVNLNQSSVYNNRAQFYAEEYNLPKTIGTDCHRAELCVGAGIVFDNKINSIHELIDGIKYNNYTICTNMH